jgi:ATP-dependent protease ClpP protease subunit
MASTLIKNVRYLDSVKNSPILIHMHSIGGSWGDGMAIYDSIQAARSHVTILAYGQAESMSSIILQAANTRVMCPNSYFMCHFGSTGAFGNYLDVQSAVKFEKTQGEVMLDIYADKCEKGKFFKEHFKELTKDKVCRYIKTKLKNGDWYLNANEAVYHGFADGVLTSRKYRGISSLK